MQPFIVNPWKRLDFPCLHLSYGPRMLHVRGHGKANKQDAVLKHHSRRARRRFDKVKLNETFTTIIGP